MFVKLLHCSIFAAVLTLSVVPAGAHRCNAVSLKAFRAAIVKNPGNAMNYYRVFLCGRTPAHMEEAESLLRWSFQKYPRIYRIEMFISWLDRMRGEAGWEATLRHAIDGMESTGDTWGVVYGGEDLAYALMDREKLAEAGALLARCAPAAHKTGNRPMQARIWAAQGVLAGKRGYYSQSLHLLLRAKKWAFPDGDYDIRCSVMNNLGGVYWYLCRYQKAYDAFRQAALLRAQSGDAWGEGIPVSNMALCGIKLVHEGDMAPRELRNLLNRGLRLAIRSRNVQVEADINNLLGLQSQGREALRHFQRALELARKRPLPQNEIEALEFSGAAAAGMGPQFQTLSELFFRQAREKAQGIGNAFDVAEIQAAEARMKALFASRQEAIDAQRAALDLIEALRAPQVRGAVRAQAFSHWDHVYYRLAGFLLQGSAVSATPRKDSALAFETMERFRARELLERLVTPRRISATQAGNQLAERREAALAQISKVQRLLANPTLPAATRQRTLDRLANLEEQESVLRDQLLRRTRTRVAASQDGVPTLAKIQALLAPDQAMLSYQLWDAESWEPRPLAIGKSWLLVITKDEARPIALPSRKVLRGRIEILDGLISARHADMHASGKALGRLYADVFQKALAILPARIVRLVIIPDDVLFRCPFAALSPGGTGRPLGSRFDISIVPSAGVWAHLKMASRGGVQIPGSAALVLFAPKTGTNDLQARVFRSAAPWRGGLRLPPLRHAVEEAQTLERVAGEGTLVLSGAAASESALKTMSLRRFKIIDLVTHAVVDEEQPERSAILLAPGSDREDGFLQVREIPALDLDGQLVILSSCSSSTGRILGGEGAQSLARAFLEAGAGAVLASLWPLEDAQAAALFSRLTQDLGRGHSVVNALRVAQRSAIDQGLPPAAWAGVVVLGDGDVRPLPARAPWLWIWLLAGIGITVSLGVVLLRRIL